ncbi:PREDICTED: uncharacterized protein C11orf52 homolog isoform X3 [Capra hircus]|uniref:uncharacterized protein C11orf52 homolog isoform X3 n=1 Tax=Capra hircus TaxID=9925 RepID=UPI000846851C|nr:PREDICTED: uncharacterized protein C11orf52 homolog isoform X3 [Capra hircus]
MGNQLCCGRSWGCTSTLQKKKKIGSQARRTLRRQQPQHERWRQLNDTKDHDTMGHTYEQVLRQLASQERSRQSLRGAEPLGSINRIRNLVGAFSWVEVCELSFSLKAVRKTNHFPTPYRLLRKQSPPGAVGTH